MATLYIDEFGDEGFRSQSSEWFILGGAIHEAYETSRIRARYLEYKYRFHRNDPNWCFHFVKATHDERLGFICQMRQAPYSALSVIVHKPTIVNKYRLSQKYWLYFYAAKILVERASWWAEASFEDTLDIVFSSRGGLTCENFREYLDRIRSSPFTQRDHIKWNLMEKGEIIAAKSPEYAGLQMADCIASSLGKALAPSKFGLVETRYIRELNPIIDRLNGNIRATGLKFFPSLSFRDIDMSRLDWIDEIK